MSLYLSLLLAVEGEIDVEQEFNTTQKPFSVLDMETGRLKYVNGESLSTVFPGECCL